MLSTLIGEDMADIILRSNAIFDATTTEAHPGFVAVTGNVIEAVARADGDDAVSLYGDKAGVRLGRRRVEDRVGTKDDVCHVLSNQCRQHGTYSIPNI